MTERQLQRVLNWINRQRVNYQKRAPLKKIPKGNRHNVTSCPIATALNGKFEAEVETYFASFCDIKGKRRSPILPPTVQDFIDEFDRGDLPQFEK